MKGFRTFIKSEELRSLVIWYNSDDGEAEAVARGILEEGQEHDFGKGYTGRSDKGLQPNQQDHLHLYLRGNQVAVINKDGTGSHGTSTSKIPNHIRGQLRNLGYNLEESMLMESASAAVAENLASSVRIFETWKRLPTNG
ncbi:MAG: hypothetical protein E5W55_12345 [Mesorhizobium sp.]|nr:MAG: hypothetical protein E5W55_12345 [Mesorhizobium sp.]